MLESSLLATSTYATYALVPLKLICEEKVVITDLLMHGYSCLRFCILLIRLLECITGSMVGKVLEYSGFNKLGMNFV